MNPSLLQAFFESQPVQSASQTAARPEGGAEDAGGFGAVFSQAVLDRGERGGSTSGVGAHKGAHNNGDPGAQPGASGAAGTDPAALATDSPIRLKMMPLGRNLNLLVATAPVDESSLTAFAQSQAMDPQAVALLMATRPGGASTAQLNSDLATGLTAKGAEGGVWDDLEALDAQLLGAGKSKFLLTSEAGWASVSIAKGQALADPSLSTADRLALRFQIDSPDALAALEAKFGESRRAERLAALTGGLKGLSEGGAAPIRLDPLDLGIGPSDWNQLLSADGLGLELNPSENKPAGRASHGVGGTQQSLDLLAGVSEGPSGPEAGQQAGLGGSQSELAKQMGQQLAQQLAQRFGELLAQRLVQQVRDGHWKVEMEIHPSELGSIQVELDFRGGELEAVFRTSHALTKEMLLDNLGRLRDSLEKNGTGVALMVVSDEGRQKNGGQSSSGGRSRSDDRSEDEGLSASAGIAPNRADGRTDGQQDSIDRSGLDVWA